jgi:type II secretory pathway component PulF
MIPGPAIASNLAIAGWFALWTAMFGGAICLVIFLISLPLQRQERARFFLDFLSISLRRGMPVEQAICGASHSRDPGLGVRFHLVASWLEKGLTLSQALEKTPGLLPPRIQAFLRVGETTGDYARVLTDCRHLANDGAPQFLKIQNYLAMLPLGLSAAGLLWLVPALLVFVMPKYRELFIDFEIAPPALLIHLSAYSHLFTLIAVTIGLLLILFMLPILFYVGGPRFARWLSNGLPRFFDWLLILLPWYRFRCERCFIGALSILLDTRVPEAEAIRLAAQCTGNQAYLRQAEVAATQLSSGQNLSAALQTLSHEREFRWRLDNACIAPQGFTVALRGWQEALEAKAFQGEQTFAQIVTTSLVLMNGALVAVLAVAFFQIITTLTQGVMLW